jgi:predicted Zn-dependent peptidase
VKELAEKWFGPIEAGMKYERNLPTEPLQQEARKQVVEKDVPVSVILKAYHIADRLNPDYYTADLITELFSGGQSSRLYQSLVKEKQLFSQIDCYHTGSVEQGLLVIEGKILPHVNPEDADLAIQDEVNKLLTSSVEAAELDKVKNKIESMICFEDLSLLNRANNLAFYELLGDAEKMNQEFANYSKVTAEEIQAQARIIFDEKNSNTLYYLSKK